MRAADVVWRIEDACPNCHGALIEMGLDNGTITQECRSCGWAVIWASDESGEEQ
jgi:hypothetical protein